MHLGLKVGVVAWMPLCVQQVFKLRASFLQRQSEG